MAYRDRVNIYQDASADGTPVPDYSGTPVYADVPCRITTVAGDETWRGRQLEAHLTHIVELQAMPDITATMRVVDQGRLDGRALNIRYVKEIDQDRGRAAKLWLYCEELAPT